MLPSRPARIESGPFSGKPRIAASVPDGAPDATGKTWTFNGMGMDPVSGEAVNYDEKITVVDNDHHVFEMYGPGPSGGMFKMMEITYTRHK